MPIRPTSTVEGVQRTIVRLLATHPAGQGLRLIGGFRLRYLDGSSRRSDDVDYAWDGDLEEKQTELVSLLQRRLLPEIKRRLDYDGTASPATGPDADSPFVKTITVAVYRTGTPGSRLEIPLDVTRMPCLDPPAIRTVDGVVFLTASNADIVESKLVSIVARPFVAGRDLVDLFLFQSWLQAETPPRMTQKLESLSLDSGVIARRLEKMARDRVVHIRSIEDILETQVEDAVVASMREAGGAPMVFETVMRLLHLNLPGGRS